MKKVYLKQILTIFYTYILSRFFRNIKIKTRRIHCTVDDGNIITVFCCDF